MCYIQQWRHHFKSGRAGDKLASGASEINFDLHLAESSPIVTSGTPSPSWAALPAWGHFASVLLFYSCIRPFTATWGSFTLCALPLVGAYLFVKPAQTAHEPLPRWRFRDGLRRLCKFRCDELSCILASYRHETFVRVRPPMFTPYIIFSVCMQQALKG